MATERIWHPKFIKYMDFIVNHPNYKGLPLRKSEKSHGWIAPAKGEIGKARMDWAKQRAKELNISEKPGFYREVMHRIHPTKKKVCQICGTEMSLDYIYLNSSFASKTNKTFGTAVNSLTSIFCLIDILKQQKVSETEIVKYLKECFPIENASENIDEIVNACIYYSTIGVSKNLGPGAMSNFPDRFDGFHSYNRCCRSKEDTGRSKENLYSYGKDRRAYEYWSDGNIHAANKFMYSDFFRGTSADHVGPISLGFIHDSVTLRKMSKGLNSSKRDRLLYDDIIELQKIEDLNNICVMSWYSEMIWEYIKNNFEKTSNLEHFRRMLKMNMNYYMEILWNIKVRCKKKGIAFLIEHLLLPKYDCFAYDYEFNESGQIVNKSSRKITDATRKEFDRFVRISFRMWMLQE